MTPERFTEITSRYGSLRIVLLGDFCLDRYLEIDPRRAETSIETKLPVHNVTRVRNQPGGAGTILNNLAALGVGSIVPVGFCGLDGEGWELRHALEAIPGVNLDHFVSAPGRRTFTYCKPLIIDPPDPPRELNRLDMKNWDPTPGALEETIVDSLLRLAPGASAIVVLDQVDHPETGVVTPRVRNALDGILRSHPGLPIFADSRRGLAGWPPVRFKMNAAELAALFDEPAPPSVETARRQAAELAARNRQPVYVTMAEDGIVGALPDGRLHHAPALPVRGPIDVVGAGDAVTANLAAATAAGASLEESLEMAMAAAHRVIHQLGTTGTASVPQLAAILGLG